MKKKMKKTKGAKTSKTSLRPRGFADLVPSKKDQTPRTKEVNRGRKNMGGKMKMSELRNRLKDEKF